MKEIEIREAWGKFYESQTGNPPDEYDCVSYADFFLALRAKELGILRAKMEAKYAEGTHPVMDIALAYIDELTEKPKT